MFAPLFTFLNRVLRAMKMKGKDEGPFDIEAFNERFVSGVKSLRGDLNPKSIELFVTCLSVAGPFARRMKLIIKNLRRALEYEDLATENPWERGAASWNNNLHMRDVKLRKAYAYIRSINQELKEKGLGYRRD